MYVILRKQVLCVTHLVCCVWGEKNNEMTFFQKEKGNAKLGSFIKSFGGGCLCCGEKMILLA